MKLFRSIFSYAVLLPFMLAAAGHAQVTEAPPGGIDTPQINHTVICDAHYSTSQACINAAAASGSSVTMQPGKRDPFTNAGNIRVIDNRSDVPATAQNITEFGAMCDTRSVYGLLSANSTTVTISQGYGALFSNTDIGRTLVAVGTISGVRTVFQSKIASISSTTTAVLTTPSPFSQATAYQMDLGHLDTAAITSAMTAVGPGGTLVIPEGACMTGTLPLSGQSFWGLGQKSQLIGLPGEDVFQAPDPSVGAGGQNGGAEHMRDFTVFVDARVDATQAWQLITDTGTTQEAALYRPIATNSGVANNPTAPGWFQGSGANLSGAYNGVAAVAANSTQITIPAGITVPQQGNTIVFPYLSTVFTTTVASVSGATVTLSTAMPAGSTGTQVEWFAGASPQHLATAIVAGSCPNTITLANSINPVAGYESNVAPFGLIQIDGEQFSYFGRSQANNPTPANTFYNVQCAQNSTTHAAHALNATVVPLNQYRPSYPWPVTPTINASNTTPVSTASYYPGWPVGNAAFAFPVANGQNPGTGAVGAWGTGSVIEDLTVSFWPVDINGQTWQAVNHSDGFYFVQLPYGAHFANLAFSQLFYGVAEGLPSLEDGGWSTALPTADAGSWENIAIRAANPWNFIAGNQNTFKDFNVYSQEGTIAGTALGSDTCFYFTQPKGDWTGNVVETASLVTAINLYCEPETGAHGDTMPGWEWDANNAVITGMHMGGAIETYIGGNDQHWVVGNFNNAPQEPAIVWGGRNSSEKTTVLGQEPKSNVYGVGSLINFGYDNDFRGTTSQAFSNPGGPEGTLQTGNSRETIPAQTNETFNTGNTTAPYVSSDGGFITAQEFDQSNLFDSFPMTTPYTYDATSPITSGYVGCAVNSQFNTTCQSYRFNNGQISIGPGQRLAAGKYTMYISVKAATATSFALGVGSYANAAANVINNFTVPVSNTWSVYQAAVDFTGLAGQTLYLGFSHGNVADTIEVGYVDFAPVAQQLNAQTLNVTNINLPVNSTGGAVSGCTASPVLGISGGYNCPTRGWSANLQNAQQVSDTTAVLTSGSAPPPVGCFFIDGEYECYTGVSGTTIMGITRGAYATSPTAHSAGAGLASIDLVLGSPEQTAGIVIAYGGNEAPILSIDNPFPFNYGGSAVFEINSGGNTLWVDTAGAIHQENAGVENQLQGSLQIGTVPGSPPIADSGRVVQTNGVNEMYAPIGFSAGISGSLNVVPPATIGAPSLSGSTGTGTGTETYECTGTDSDGNFVPGTPASLTNVNTTWVYPFGFQVSCPYAAGIASYQVYRVSGGPNQGLVASGSGQEGYVFNDFFVTATAGLPPATNTSNPHISVTGAPGTNPTITMGTAGLQITSAPGVPTACGTTYGNGSLYINTTGSTSANNLLYACNAATSTWVDIK